MESTRPQSADPDREESRDPVPILKSKDYISSLKCGWLPVHGVEFFTMFVQELVPQWKKLLDAAEVHLSGVVSYLAAIIGVLHGPSHLLKKDILLNFKRKNLLRSGGETCDLIKPLLKDAEKWIMLRRLLQEHVRVASDFLKFYENNDFLREEVATWEHRGKLPKRTARDSGLPFESPRLEYFDIGDFPKPNTWSSSKQLRRAIKDLKKCQRGISSLDKDTKTMIQLVGGPGALFWFHCFPIRG
jgi:hypothetical protein